MIEKKKEEPVGKPEKKTDSLEEKFDKFITNDFSHLVAKVDTLIEQNGGIQKDMATMKKEILEALGARAHNWVGKKK